jgi:CRISPR-associated endoribonuclease Cas6
MKFKVKLRGVDSPIVLPIHYNHILKGFIFSNLLKGEEVPFTFSNLFGMKRIHNKRIVFKESCHFYVSTLNESLINCKSLNQEVLQLGKNRVKVEEVSSLEEEINEPLVKVKTLSPITVFHRDRNGKTHYFSPESQEFYKILEENLNEKAEKLLNSKLPPVKIRASKESIFKKAVIQYRNRFVIEAWKGIFEIEGERKAIEAALKLGLGFKNNQGFGMVAISP